MTVVFTITVVISALVVVVFALVVVIVAMSVMPADRVQRAKESLGLAERSGGEEQRLGATGFVSIAEDERPKAVNHDGVVVRVFKQTAKITVGFEGHDRAAAEVADEQSVAMLPKRSRSDGQAPWRIDFCEPSARVGTSGETMEFAGYRIESIDQA